MAAYYSTSGLSKIAARLVLRARKYMTERKQKIASCSYLLHEPKQHTRELYVKIMKTKSLRKSLPLKQPATEVLSRSNLVSWRMLFITLLYEKY